jgi:hypothetical protein
VRTRHSISVWMAVIERRRRPLRPILAFALPPAPAAARSPPGTNAAALCIQGDLLLLLLILLLLLLGCLWHRYLAPAVAVSQSRHRTPTPATPPDDRIGFPGLLGPGTRSGRRRGSFLLAAAAAAGATDAGLSPPLSVLSLLHNHAAWSESEAVSSPPAAVFWWSEVD